MSISSRLEQIRTNEKLSRVKFGLKVGKSDDAIYNLERDRATITDEFIELVCEIFNVNKDWLINGEGSMYDVSNESLDLGNTLNQIIDSKELTKLISEIIKLSDKKKKIISDLVEVLSETEKK